MNKVVIGLGSNIDPQKNIRKAKESLAQRFRILAETPLLTTKPIGYQHQADFLNGSVLIETDLTLKGLKTVLKNIEKSLGRQKNIIKFAPRTIDLDILVFNGKIIHQDFYAREFIREDVLQLLPDLKYKSKF